MNSTASLLPRCARRVAHAVALALMITPSLPLASGQTNETAAPPHQPDAVHVPEGCYISTVAYLGRFAVEFPGEWGAPFTAFLASNRWHHTVALVTWRGEWWLRDEFLGAIRMNLPVASRAVTAPVARHAEATLGRVASQLSRAQRARIAVIGRRFDATHEVAKAAKLLPFPGEVFLVSSHGREIPLLFFRPAPGCIAVYDPHFGTAVAETTTGNSAKVVEVVAERLGYKVTSVRPETRHLIAAIGR